MCRAALRIHMTSTMTNDHVREAKKWKWDEQAYAVRFVDVDHDCRARAREALLGRYELRVFWCAELVHFASAEQSEDACSALEGTEHDRNSPVLPQVRDCLRPCAYRELHSETP